MRHFTQLPGAHAAQLPLHRPKHRNLIRREGTQVCGSLSSKDLDRQALALVDELLRAPYITVAEAQRLLNVTNPTARTAVETLVAAGLLEEVGDRKWRRLYVARPVLDVLKAPMEEM